ncbi:TauD/TfdA family dioxygenase [Granulosicoccus antarcticus]|uniref:Gamma-butyrobetaine dioxygenase n=1 Tax=Granulosicoccus antarcticus IMCC3135 TaxID=1192854 RepID=A0A2Z2NTC7_9GAMM|nr:TauD/TfdA family dioxygenase [Granulosicoccus antarcticus]ASJ73775.1 Gamma-butyrobetaine dioxygenase [Granulosicoccus antarcticus IMCC3135]
MLDDNLAPSEIPTVTLAEKGLHIPLSSGSCYFNYYWLRDADPTNIDPATRERIFDITEIEGGPVASSAFLEEQTLLINWVGESHVSRIPLTMLDQFMVSGRNPDPAMIPRRLWKAGAYDTFARFEQSDIEASDSVRQSFARALIEDGVALVTKMEDSNEALTRLANQLGQVTPTADGHYFDVRLEIAPTNLAYTARALEFHTDLPSEDAAPGVQFLHCRSNTVSGGYSLFLDGAAAAEAFRESDPAGFELLASHDIPFFRRNVDWDYRAHQRVIELDRDDQVSGLTISQHLQDTMDLTQDVLDDYYPAFCRFLSLLKEDRFVNRFRLEGGSCIVFDNHRVVHGREAFEANSGSRHLRGCYVDRGALRSTYRTLVKRSV